MGRGLHRGGERWVGGHTHTHTPPYLSLRTRSCGRGRVDHLRHAHTGAVTLMSGDVSRCSSDLSILRDQQASRRWLGLGLGLRLRLARASPSPNPSQAMRRVVGYCP